MLLSQWSLHPRPVGEKWIDEAKKWQDIIPEAEFFLKKVSESTWFIETGSFGSRKQDCNPFLIYAILHMYHHVIHQEGFGNLPEKPLFLHYCTGRKKGNV